MVRSRAASAFQAAAAGVRAYIDAFARAGGLPRGFWEDAFVLGFLTLSVQTFSRMATSFRLADRDLGLVTSAVFDQLSGGDGTRILRRIQALGAAGNPDFREGARNADKILCVAHGMSRCDDDPDVVRARAAAHLYPAPLVELPGARLGGAPHVSALIRALFFDIVERRLGTDPFQPRARHAPEPRRDRAPTTVRALRRR